MLCYLLCVINLRRQYHSKNDLYIYFGHGGGETVCSRGTIGTLPHCPSATLWGCGSGALEVHGVHDPVGLALAYLDKGALFVVGNLWTVSDMDCDRFSTRFLSSLLSLENIDKDSEESEGERLCELAALVGQSRDACVMKRVVGYAPVVYGLPVAYFRHH